MSQNGSGPTSTAVVEDEARKSDQLASEITSDNNASANANQAQLIKTIKAHIAKGDKAREKADQHYIAAGKYLKELKGDLSQAEFLEIVREKIGIGKSRIMSYSPSPTAPRRWPTLPLRLPSGAKNVVPGCPLRNGQMTTPTIPRPRPRR